MFDENSYNDYINKNDIYANLCDNKCICPLCGKKYSLYGIKNHIKYHFGFTGFNHSAWNKGLTKETDNRVKKIGETLHNKAINGEIDLYWKGKQHTKETKNKISESMKTAHKEERAHNIGQSRWNNEPSYPESFMMKVIANELTDKNYVREYSFHRYSFDFAWPHLMKYIEIDGEQHLKETQKLSDIKKDTLAKSEGWICLRILWKDLFNNTKEYINIIKQFIDEN